MTAPAFDKPTDSGPVSPIAGVAVDDWAEFVERMAEPSCAYIVNAAGFVGLFLFSMARLARLGVVANLRREPREDGTSKWVGEFVPPLTLEEFLESTDLQYRAFERSCVEYHRALLPRTVPAMVDGIEVSLSGLLSVCHRAGEKGLAAWLSDPHDRLSHPFTTETFTRCNGVF